MRTPNTIGLLSLLLAPPLVGCVGTTGSGIVDFDAYASGPEDASGAPGSTHVYSFVSPYSGYAITLTTATLQIGAVYLDATPCTGSSDVPPCVDQNAATVAEVNNGVTGAFGAQSTGILLDVLSPDPQQFPAMGDGLIQDAASAEVWLTKPDSTTGSDAIDDISDNPTVATVAGSASKNGATYPFTATVTIGENRLLPVQNPALPGANPICLQRIVRPICLTPALEPEPGTSLHMRVDPKGWFNNVDFAALAAAGGSPPFAIPDNNDDTNGHNFFQGLESSSGVYSFSFQSP